MRSVESRMSKFRDPSSNSRNPEPSSPKQDCQSSHTEEISAYSDKDSVPQVSGNGYDSPRTSQSSTTWVYTHRVLHHSNQENPPPSYDGTSPPPYDENSRSSDIKSILAETTNVSEAEVNQPLVTDGFEGYVFTESTASDNATNISKAVVERPVVTDGFKWYNSTKPSDFDIRKS